jgi:hypothetical protein
MWREFDLDTEFPRPTRLVPLPEIAGGVREGLTKPIQTPNPVLTKPLESWIDAPTILTRYEGLGEQIVPSRASLVAQIRRELSIDAPYLTITQCIDLTTELATTLLPNASASEIKIATRKLLIARCLLYHSARETKYLSVAGHTSPRANGNLEVVVAAPLFQSDGTISVFGTVSAHLDAVSEWTLAKGNVLANVPVSLGAMFTLGGAESRVVDSRGGVSTVQLEIYRGALLPTTQYTAFLCCRTECASSVDSVTFCT